MSAPSIVILTGAGISAASGIPTFRDSNGLWENHHLEDVASPQGFARDPLLVHQFYNARRAQLLSPAVQPNPAHLALAELEAAWRGDFLLVTQNVDDLHERAGSRSLRHMHGELLKARCRRTGEVFPWRAAITPSTPCPGCKACGCLRPHIVWFGEMPLDLEEIFSALSSCAIFAAIGTSGQVYPAAGFVHQVPAAAHTVEINEQQTGQSPAFAEHLRGPASETVPRWVEVLRQQ